MNRELHEGKDFDVKAERDAMMGQSPETLAFALKQVRATAIPQPTPPLGRGASLRPIDDKERAKVAAAAGLPSDEHEPQEAGIREHTAYLPLVLRSAP